MELLSLWSDRSGATPVFVFSFLLVWPQKAFGSVFAFIAMSFSNHLLAFCSNVFTLFLSRFYCLRVASASAFIRPRLVDIHTRWLFSFFLILDLAFSSIGILPLSFHVGLLDAVSSGTMRFVRRCSCDFIELPIFGFTLCQRLRTKKFHFWFLLPAKGRKLSLTHEFPL